MSTGLTKEDRRKLGEWADSGLNPNSVHSDIGTDVSLNNESTPSQPWRLDEGRSDVTRELCDAIRCAAEDGLSYARIAELFNSVTRSSVRRHARGECCHTNGLPPVLDDRSPGPVNKYVTEDKCLRLRNLYERGYFDTYEEAGEWLGRAKSTAIRHIKGECKHAD